MEQVIAKARELGRLIQQEECYKNLMLARANNDDDAELQKLIGDFNLQRVALSQAMSEENRDQEKISAMDKELKALYAQIMQNPNMLAFNAAKQAVDTMMTKLNQILVGSVNGDDPDAIDVESSCSGDCSGCAGCH